MSAGTLLGGRANAVARHSATSCPALHHSGSRKLSTLCWKLLTKNLEEIDRPSYLAVLNGNLVFAKRELGENPRQYPLL